MGINSVDFSRNYVYIMEMTNNYTNLANHPHQLILYKKNKNHVLLKKKFATSNEAILYLDEALKFKDNKNKLRFEITGPNMLYIG